MPQDPHVVQLSLHPRFHGALPGRELAGLYQVFERSETIVIRLAATRETIYRRLDAMKRNPSR